MYIFNTSFMVGIAVHDRWLALVRDKYIPLLKREGFDRATLCRVMSFETPSEFTYSLQVRVAAFADYRRLAGELLAEYETFAGELFGGQVAHFVTLMKVIEE